MQNNLSWLQGQMYPFKSQYFQSKDGQIHYIDEGQGSPIVFVHGTPTWSFLYRHLIKDLSKQYRCIAIDHLGFGLSEKPQDAPLRVQNHAQRFEAFMEYLNIPEFTLVVHDFGGPIALPYAIKNPQKINKLVIFNTWLWATKDNPDLPKIDKLLKSWIGRFLYLNMNFSPKFLIKQAFFDQKKLSKSIHQHYIKVFPNKAQRQGPLQIALSLAEASDWYESHWQQIDALQNIPMLILWGKEDSLIKAHYLDIWKERFPKAKVHELEAGHFPQEECPDQVLYFIEDFL